VTSLVFPDINVWVALSHPDHAHHQVAETWYRSLNEADVLVFCRHTQLGFFRLMTTAAVLGQDVRTAGQCWKLYDLWIEPGEAIFAFEPEGLEAEMRIRTSSQTPNPKEWADAYLAAFAETAQLTLVTFDKALAGKAKGAVLLA
jgi:toxin-antitoxin system PIN domain toxin